MTPAATDDARAVLDFWFGAPGSATDGKPRAEWFRKSDAFDRAIERGFAPLIEAALAGGLREWDAQPASALARIVLLDQFTRNVFRGTPRAFAGDALALAAARALVADGRDLALPPQQRAFAYLPFEHAEDLAMQDESMRLYTRLDGEAQGFAGTLDYARRHRAIIERFGRFPHRNAILGRASSAEEIAFLEQPGSSF
ncbi:MAG TPA: DUF924 family protein [Burkholderiaceae bacterium]|jgi:uncharacterized protein (DUF924 family)|nr:DUF924 family protein [Burkholderiaceae bacterium]